MRIRGWFLCIVLLTSGIAGCSSGDSGGGGLTTSAQALGFAYKGAITQASVSLYALRSTGVRGQMIGQGQVDNQGFFDITVANYTGWALAVLAGGLVTDFLGNTSTIDPAFPLMGLVRLQQGVATLYSITVLSTLAVYAMQAEMLRGGVRLSQAILNAEQRIGLMFGIGLGLLTLVPFDLTSGPISATPQTNYGAVTHGFCELAINLGISEVVLMHMLGRDILDGQLDAKFFGRDILSPASVLLPLTVWTSLWPLAITNFMLSSFNLSGLLPADIAAIATLSALAVVMLQAPRILSLYPGYLDITRDNVYEIRGPDVPTAANARVIVGDQEIDAVNVLDLAGGGLRVDVLVAVAALIDWGTKGKAHFTVEDTVSGLSAGRRVERIDTSLAPTVTRHSPAVAAAGGGTLIEVEGDNISDLTTVTVGGMSAKVLAAGTNKLTYYSPRLGPATFDVELTNPGGSTTVPNAVTVKDKDLSAGETETEAKDQYSFAWQAGYNLDKFASFLRFDTRWTDDTVGSTTVNRSTVRENDTTVRTDTINANSFYAQLGHEERQLHDDGSGFNFFMLSARNQNVRTGNGPDATVMGWEIPTAVTRDILAGRHKVVVQQWNFEERWRRYMSGYAELGTDGFASIILWCWETDLDTGVTTMDLLWSAFDWDTGLDGHVTWSPLDGSTGFPNVDIWFDGNGRLGVGGGTDGDSLIYATSLRLGPGSGAYTALGAFLGNHQREETIVNGSTRQRTDIGFERNITGCDGAWSQELDVVEQNTRFSDDTDIKFDWKLGYKLSLTAGSGIQYDDQFQEVGAVFRDGDFGARISGAVNGNAFDYGTQVFVPSFQSKESLLGKYFDVTFTIGSDGDGSSGEFSDGWVATDDYDPDTAPQIDGSGFKLGGVRTTQLKAGQEITRDPSRTIGVDSFSTTEPSVKNYTFAGRTAIFFVGDAADNLNLRRLGYLDPSSNALLLSSTGAGNRTGAEIAFRAGSSPVSFDGRNYHVSKIERGYNLANGDLSFALETCNMNFDAGSVSGSGSRTEFFENNTTNSGSLTVGGTYSGRMDGLTDFTSGGRTWVLVPFIDGSSFIAGNLDNSGFQTLVYGTEDGTGLPATGNFASLRFALSFDDFSPFPPAWSAVSGVFTDGFSGPSLITQTGALGIRSNISMEPTIFQMFQTSGIMFDSNRNVTYTEGTSTTRTGTASECQNVVTEVDIPGRRILLEMRLNW